MIIKIKVLAPKKVIIPVLTKSIITSNGQLYVIILLVFYSKLLEINNREYFLEKYF